ncbi:MAG: hypothetical protein ABIX10_08260 [Acidimicrobiales bacterium]
MAALAVLGQLLSRQVRPPAAQRQALTAIGLTRAQLVADPLSAVALPVVIGSVAAGGLAFAASGLFPIGFAERLEPIPGRLFEPLVHAFGPFLVAASLVTWVLISLLLGDRPPEAPHRPGRAERLASQFRLGPAAIGSRFALTRHPRDPGTVRAPVIGLVLVLGVLVGALTFGASVNSFIDEPARYGANFDFATGAGGDSVPEALRSVLEDDPDVTDLTLFGTVLANVGSTSLDVTGMETVRGALEPEVLVGRLVRGADDILLGRVAARQLDVGVGDDVVVIGANGPATFQVTGLGLIPAIEGGDGIGEGGVVTLDGLRRLDPEASSSVATVRLRPGAAGVADRIREATGITVGPLDRPSEVVNLQRARTTPFLWSAPSPRSSC